MKIQRYQRTKREPGAGMKVREVAFDLKAKADQPGKFEGYGSIFGNVDSYGEIVAPGAFSESLKERAAKGRKLPILWQHSAREPLGVYDVVKEDKTGLWVEGSLLIDQVQRAKETHALMAVGAVSGLSIGYYVDKYEVDNDSGVVTLTAVDLVEVSIVTFPANDEARIEFVRAKGARGETLTKREMEVAAREAMGMSRREATAFVAAAYDGYVEVKAGRDASSAEAVELLEGLRAFTVPAL